MKPVSIKLIGVIKSQDNETWVKAKPHQTNEVKYLVGALPGTNKIGFRIDIRNPAYPVLVTNKGQYPLTCHESQNYWLPSESPIKCHVILKKISGQLLYWP